MKTPTSKQTAHCFAAVLAIATTIATGAACAANVVWNGNAANGSLSDGGNWDGGVAPAAGDTLDFSAVTSATTLNADFADGREFATLLVGSGNLTLNGGTLKLTTVTNAYTLGVSSGATLAISGDLVGYAARNTKPLLRSNEGTVTVGGLVRFRSGGTSKGDSTVSQYASANDNSSPIMANGLAYYADSWKDYLIANLGSMSNGPGKWVVGAGGLTIPYSRQIGHSGFRVRGSQAVTLHSSADWTATINIDGDRLRSGEHVLCTLASVPENLANHVTVTGTALGGRKYEVKAVEVTENETTITQLVLNIYPAGLMMIIR